MKRVTAVMLACGVCVGAFACTQREEAPAVSTATATTYATIPDWYAPPPPVRTYPSPADTIHKWIQALDTTHIRAHAWDIWESITTQVNDSMPVWETWYAGHEIFPTINVSPNVVAAGVLPDSLRRHRLQHKFEIPRQRVHAGGPGRIHLDSAERWFSFNRFTRPTATYIYKTRLWDFPTLRDTNQAFNRLNTPVAAREISVTKGVVDPESFALKPVFQFVDGKNPSCIPYWNGHTAATASDTLMPVANTWKQFVVFDPVNALKDAKTAGNGIPGCPAGNLPVVNRSNFYSVTLTQEMADSLSTFAAENGDDIGAGNATDSASIRAMAKPGNIALLVAMHVTGKEIVEWTWQTFWWSPTPNDSLGYDRPATIKSPWNNYQMNTAYQMVTPAHSKRAGKPRVAYNPYLETSLRNGPGTSCVNTTWYGVSSNCMSCHRMAAWKDTTVNRSESFTNPPYMPATYVDKGNPACFAGYTKTDFLWSVALRTFVPRVPPGGVQPPPNR